VSDTGGSKDETYDVSLEQQFKTGTYLAVSGEILRSRLNNVQGAFVFDGDYTGPLPYQTFPTGLNQSLEYEEQSLQVTLDQLLGKEFSVGVQYRLSKARFDMSFPQINPANLNSLNMNPPELYPNQRNLESLFHTAVFHVNWNHPSGLFSSAEADWYHQDNSGFASGGFGAPEPGQDFWQFNLYAGYRFWHRHAECSVGLLNAADQNYSLEPLSFYNEMARRRTLVLRFLFSF
jgi:hypothetical protein